MYNRVTSDSNSDAAFASCTTLPIHQTMLNVVEMADIDGLGGLVDAIDAAVDYISDVVDKIGDSISDFVDSAYFYPQDAEPIHYPNTLAPPPRSRELNIVTFEKHVCDQPVVHTSCGTCLCPEVMRPCM